MTRLAYLALLVAATGCPPQRSPAGPQQQAPLTGPGCPSAAGVYIASYMTAEDNAGHSGWVLPLHALKVEPGATVPEYAQLDAAAAAASGVPQAPAGTLWLVGGATPPCRVTAGSYYTARADGPPASISYGVELQGCPAPTNPQDSGGVVLMSNEAPTGCRFEQPQPIAARLGQMDAQHVWHAPTTATPIPPAIAPLIPQHACQPPGCEQLWAFAEVDLNQQPVAWAGAVNWLTVGDPAKACEWKAEAFSGFFVPGTGGAPVMIETDQEHPLALDAVLVDAQGAKVALADGPGAFATYDLSPGKATLAHQITWMLAPNEAWDAIDHLGPMCESPATAPAPLPKDAKPVSPYP